MGILCAFSREQREMGLKDLSLAMDLSKSTVYRLCVTLVRFGFLRCDEVSGKYSLGLKLFDLGGIVFSSFSLREAAGTHLTRLRDRTGESVFLGILQDDFLLYLDKRQSRDNPIQFRTDIGTVRQPFFGMLGQVLLAFLPEQAVESILDRVPLKPITEKSIRSRKKLRERLERIRSQGYSFEKGEVIEGVGGIAAPVYNHSGGVMAAVGIRFIYASVNDHRVERLIEAVCETARHISRDLGYRGGDRRYPASDGMAAQGGNV